MPGNSGTFGCQVVAPRAISRNWRRPGGVGFQTVSIVGRPEIEERVHVDLVVVDTDAAADDQIFTFCRLVGKAEPGSKIVLVPRKDRTNAIALDLDAAGGDEDGEVFAVVVEWTEVVPA